MSKTSRLEILDPTKVQIEQARELVSALKSQTSPTVRIQIGESSHEVPAQLAGLVEDLLKRVAQGQHVSIGGTPEEVTTTVAAKMLGMSRPTLMKLVRERRIPSRSVGKHTRLRAEDVLAYRKSEWEARDQAFERLRNPSEDLEMAP
ncbi:MULTISPECIES: helix-turn-helix domain-containing protein [Kocuria]|uniref:Helix-turn-helix domain-containing protein n=1 Tax=Kocuria rosea subsp. polaris TaxID=136273 RepID=A0A0W8I1A5_KOCRO|nr:helix-turn-helix domain-containing protein [Kocuria polaris]KUG51243.1 hypothetical protein AVL61_10565 [Kocuria polaris]